MSFINTLGWTLLHFLWQGAAVALLLAGANRILRQRASTARYGAACVAMVLNLACVVGTFFWLASDSMGAGSSVRRWTPAGVAQAMGSFALAAPTASAAFSAYLPWMVYLWLAGVAALSMRSLAAWAMVQRLKNRETRPAPADWQQSLARLAQRLAISRPVRLCESAIAEVPAVIGWIRPVILLPASALTGLTPRQLESVLAHELAHIRRHDYLVNLLQTAAETLLFYHPAVWWVGRKMRAERENCCDDLAVSICGDPLVYARALTELEQLRHTMPGLAMAADGGSLLDRIQRLLQPAQPVRSGSLDWITVSAIVLSVVAMWAGPSISVAARAPNGLHLFIPRTPVLQAVSLDMPEVPVPPAPPVTPETPVAPEPPMTPQAPVPPPAPAPPESQGFIGGLEAAGYRNLSVDDLLSLKIHGVTPDYVRKIQAAGFKPTIEDLVSFRIHGVTPEYLNRLKADGLRVNIEQLISFRVHGADPDRIQEMKALGYTLDPEQVVTMQVHGLTPDFVKALKQAGVRRLDFEQLIALKIHGAEPAEIREIQALGYPNLDTEDVVALRIHGVTPGFIRKAQSHGLKNLSIEKMIRLKQQGILDDDAGN